MTHRQQSHAAGTFPTCPQCDTEPRHILDGRRRPIGGHLMSCRCGETAKFDDLSGAIRNWCRIRDVSMTVRAAPSPLRAVGTQGGAR